jgi:hypothetical protein
VKTKKPLDSHHRGVWLQVTTPSTAPSVWIRCSSLADGLLRYKSFQSTPGVLTLHLFQHSNELRRFTADKGDQDMGLLSNAQKNVDNDFANRPFVSASMLAASGVKLQIEGVRTGNFNDKEQLVLDMATLDGAAIKTGKMGHDGELIASPQFTVTMTMDATRKSLYETLIDSVDFPYFPVWFTQSEAKNGRQGYITLMDE